LLRAVVRGKNNFNTIARHVSFMRLLISFVLLLAAISAGVSHALTVHLVPTPSPLF
jgi:hypothetical protein